MTRNWLLAAAPLVAVACSSQPPDDSANAKDNGPVWSENAASASTDEGADAAQEISAPMGVANLPYARGKVFASLDDYLEHLEKQGAIDLPWWREIEPGVYERVVRMPEVAREIKTRAELLKLYGFER